MLRSQSQPFLNEHSTPATLACLGYGMAQSISEHQKRRSAFSSTDPMGQQSRPALGQCQSHADLTRPCSEICDQKGEASDKFEDHQFQQSFTNGCCPYTPLSARRGVVGPAGPAKDSDSKDRFVGKLSFTPHVSQHRHSHSAHKRSPDSSLGEPSASSSSLAQPPQSSLYIADPKTLNAVTASAGEQLATLQIFATGTAYACNLQLSLCCVPCHQPLDSATQQ